MNICFSSRAFALCVSLCAFITITHAEEDQVFDLFSSGHKNITAVVSPTINVSPSVVEKDSTAAPQQNEKNDPLNIKFTPEPITAPGHMWIRGDGQPVTLENYRGKWVILNLWATWCMPCVAEMPTLDKLHRRYNKAGVEVIAINVNGTSGGGRIGLEDIQGFYRRAGVKYLPVHIDPQGFILPAFAARKLPTTYLINPDGMIFAVVDGAEDWFSPNVRHLVEQMIKATPKKEETTEGVVDLFAQ